MARATWTGFLSFGLVSIPIGLFTATTDQSIHFNQIHKGTSHRVRYKKVDEETGEELTADDIVSGFPVGGGEYVIVSREELKEVAPGKSDLVDISEFVELADIDPKYFRQTYYLAPRGKGADRAYALLHRTLREMNKVAIGTLVLREQEHLVAIRANDDVLVLETMYFQDEIRDPKQELDELPQLDYTGSPELDIARRLVESMTTKWDPSRYKNTYRERVHELVEMKRAGHSVTFVETDRPKSNVIDLMAALEASISRTRSETQAPPAAASSEQPKVAASHEQQSFEGMSKAELLAKAKDLRVDVNPRMTKLQLVQALSEAQPAAADEQPAAKKRSRRAS